MALGIIIGTAFGKIVSSLISDVIMPSASMIPGHVDISQLFIYLSRNNYATLAAAQEAGAATINYGIFISTVLDFVIVTFEIFAVIRGMNNLNKEEEKPAEPPSPSDEVLLFRQIRNALKSN